MSACSFPVVAAGFFGKIFQSRYVSLAPMPFSVRLVLKIINANEVKRIHSEME